MGLNWTPSSPALRGDSLPVTRPRPAKAALSPAAEPGFQQVAQRIRAEYLEMPGLNLTHEQARCLWGLDADVCDRVLTYLMETGFLTRTAHARYVRAGGV